MEKYKDFQDLKDTNQQSLRDLFNRRNYGRYIDNQNADDIIISDVSLVSKWVGDVPVVEMIDFNPDKKPSTYEERMEIRNKGYSAAYQFSKTNDIESAEFELSYLNPSEIEDRYLRKRVKAYLNICRKISTGNEYTTDEQEKDYTRLFNDLINIYIKDISLDDFNVVMNYRILPIGKGKIMWLGKKAEAVYFQKEIEFTMKQLNKCFVWKDGTKFAENNRLTTIPKQSFIDILTRHKQQ